MSIPGGFCLGDARDFKITPPATDVDYTYQDFFVRAGHGWQVMRHGEGLTYTGGVPLESLVCNGNDFEENISQLNGMTYVDSHGKNADGTLWRYAGRLGESVDYRKADPASARKFDDLLENLCIMKPEIGVSPLKPLADKIIR